jgi:hypothetical protein
MLFYLIVLAICQIGILAFYCIESSNPTAGKFKIIIPSPRHLSVINVLAAIAIFSVNRLGQFFCVPVDWAAIVLVTDLSQVKNFVNC